MYLQNSFDDFERYNLFNNSDNIILLQKIFVKQHLGMVQTKLNINLFSVLNHVINISMCVKTNKIIMTSFLPSNGYKTKGNTDPFFFGIIAFVTVSVLKHQKGQTIFRFMYCNINRISIWLYLILLITNGFVHIHF